MGADTIAKTVTLIIAYFWIVFLLISALPCILYSQLYYNCSLGWQFAARVPCAMLRGLSLGKKEEICVLYLPFPGSVWQSRDCTFPESCWVAAKGPSGLWVGGADGEKVKSSRPAVGVEMRRLLGRTGSRSCNKFFRAMKSGRVCSEEGLHVAGLRARLEGKVLLCKEQQQDLFLYLCFQPAFLLFHPTKLSFLSFRIYLILTYALIKQFYILKALLVGSPSS